MRLCYQISTPEVKKAPGVTAYQADLEDSYKALLENGYEGVELMVDNPSMVDSSRIKELSDKYNLPVAMICTGEVFGQSGLTFNHPEEEKRKEAVKRVKDAVDLAVKLDCGIVNIGRVRGGFSLGGDHEKERALSIEGMKAAGQYAGEKGIVIALEPVNSIAASFINTTQEGMAIVDEIGLSSFKLMLDSNHMFIDDKDLLKSIEDAKDYFVYVHLADSNRLYPGNCKLDFEAFIKKLKEVGYDGWVSVEVFQRPDQDIALKKSAAFLKPMIESLS